MGGGGGGMAGGGGHCFQANFQTLHNANFSQVYLFISVFMTLYYVLHKRDPNDNGWLYFCCSEYRVFNCLHSSPSNIMFKACMLQKHDV